MMVVGRGTAKEQRLPTSTEPKKHPLSDLVLSAFTTPRTGHDFITMAQFLGAATEPQYAWKAYKTVAEDVMLLLSSQDKLYRDDSGWFYRRF
jgi:hypothetical protein